MKYAMLRQQPLLRVQVAASLKKNFFFLKKEITKHLPSGKTNKSIMGAKNASSKLKDGCVRKTNTSKVRGQTFFKKSVLEFFSFSLLVNLKMI